MNYDETSAAIKKFCDCIGTVRIIKDGIEYCPLLLTDHRALYEYIDGHKLRLPSNSGGVYTTNVCELGMRGLYDNTKNSP